jgi:hypothetical protein
MFGNLVRWAAAVEAQHPATSGLTEIGEQVQLLPGSVGCEDQMRRTRRGPIASLGPYVAYNTHSRHLHMGSREGLHVCDG